MDFDLNDLFHQLSVKANVVRKAVDFCKGDKAATVAVINSIYLEGTSPMLRISIRLGIRFIPMHIPFIVNLKFEAV